MAYSTRANVEKRLSALEDSSLPTDIDDRITARVTEGIEYADSLIDGKLSARYTVPFSPVVPKLIKGISADLAAAFTLDGGFSGGGEDEPTSLSNTLRARAMDLLNQLADGTIVLSPTEAPAPDPSSAGIVPNHSRLGQRPSLECFNLYDEPNWWRRP